MIAVKSIIAVRDQRSAISNLKIAPSGRTGF